MWQSKLRAKALYWLLKVFKRLKAKATRLLKMLQYKNLKAKALDLLTLLQYKNLKAKA